MHGLRHPVLPLRVPAGQPHPGVERPGPAGTLGRGRRATALDQQLPRGHRADLPRPVRGLLHPGHQPARGHHQADRGGDRGADLRQRLARAGRAGPPERPHRGRRRLGPGGTGRGAAAHPRRLHRGGLRARRAPRRPAAAGHPGLQAGEGRPGPAPGADGGRGHPVPHRRGDRRRPALGPAQGPLRRRDRGDRRPRGPRAARPRPRPRRDPPRHGLPRAVQPRGRRRRGPGPDLRRGAPRGDPRRRRHGRGLHRHRAPPGGRP